MVIEQYECARCGYVYDECNCKDKKERMERAKQRQDSYDLR